MAPSESTPSLQAALATLRTFAGQPMVLDQLAGTVGSEGPIQRLGVYFARHGVLQVISVQDAYRPGLLPQLVSWFDDSLPIT